VVRRDRPEQERTIVTKPKTEIESGIGPHWKVRVVFQGALLHLVSRTEPVVRTTGGKVTDVAMSPIEGTEHGDTLGFVDWSAVVAVTWRRAGEGREP
jgi:hypothetical protein